MIGGRSVIGKNQPGAGPNFVEGITQPEFKLPDSSSPPSPDSVPPPRQPRRAIIKTMLIKTRIVERLGAVRTAVVDSYGAYRPVKLSSEFDSSPCVFHSNRRDTNAGRMWPPPTAD